MHRNEWRELIKEAFPDAYAYADGAIIIDRDLCIVFFSDGAGVIFGYDPLETENSSIALIECEAISPEFLTSEFNFFLDQFLLKGLFTQRGRPVKAGEPLTAKTNHGQIVLVRAGVHPLQVVNVLHLIIFFQQCMGKTKEQNEAALHNPLSPFQKRPTNGPDAKQPDSSNPWIFGLQTIIFLYKFSPPLFLLVLFLSIGGFGVLQADNVLKIFNKLIAPAPLHQEDDQRKIDVSDFDVD